MKRRTWLRLNGIKDSNTFNMDRYMNEKRKQAQEAEAPLFKDICPVCGGDSCKCGSDMCDCDEKRMDIIGQNGNDGEHYEEVEGRWNWYGAEKDATGMEEDLPYAAEDCAKTKGNYEL